jgi:ADP-ribosyl-[dinitrogen reductase] hydrolase
VIRRAQGCLLGQIAGDALGSALELRSAEEIGRRYPGGPRLIAENTPFGTLPSQPTDDSGRPIHLARSSREK